LVLGDAFAPRSGRIPVYPPVITLPLTIWTAVLIPVYWVEHGPGNFLWFSDIALFLLLVSAWTGHRLLYSMMAVGVLPMETMWLVDFLVGGTLTGIAAYMFDADGDLYLRVISGFHFVLPPLIVWMLYCQGYDRRAIWWQWVLGWCVLVATYLLTDPEDNINWVFGPNEPQDTIPGAAYLGLYMLLLPPVVYLPMHWLLRRLFGGDGAQRHQRRVGRGGGAKSDH
jgi:hypothetical protein